MSANRTHIALFATIYLILGTFCLYPNIANGQILADWFSGPGNWRDASNWENGVGVPDNNAPDFYQAAIDSNAGVLSVVRLLSTDHFIVDRLTLDEIDELILEGNSSLQIVHDTGRPMSGVISNGGTIFLSSDVGSGLTELHVETDVALLGGGSIVMSMLKTIRIWFLTVQSTMAHCLSMAKPAVRHAC